jgi:uncharacterized protein
MQYTSSLTGMKRYLYSQILQDLKKKMVFLTGPRQIGKTFLAKQIMEEFENPQYLNYDNIIDHRVIRDMSWAQNSDLIVFDEIHKMKDWKNYIKGVYDSKQTNQSILVTGSARLDTYRQTGDSLAGRYLHIRLNPISVKEIFDNTVSPYNIVELLNSFGGFPEPFLAGLKSKKETAQSESARWRNQYFTDIVREDIQDFSRINEIKTMKHLIQLLRIRVGSPLSFNAISEDLQISPNTVKKYIQILESLYIIFLIYPFHKNIARSILKVPKAYFYDTGYVQSNEGIKLENTCAISLLKYAQYLYDAKGYDIKLHYMKTKENKEIDFAIIKDGKPFQFIEVKYSDSKISQSLKYFANKFENVEALQLVHNLHQNESIKNINVVKAGEWLSRLEV